ncbi:MAG: flagellar hook-basal body complex protein [Anaerolineales bacterium]|nr:flagellar hook-basal body complex protein [Anaerolineales bacterium]
MASSFIQILNITRSSIMSRMTDLDVVSHNLANINTPGYKSSRSAFQELLDEFGLAGVEIGTTQRIMTQGSLQDSDNPLDLAINGSGFFAVQIETDQIGYTRDGQFSLDEDRRIVDSNGYELIWNGTIPEDAEDVHVNPDGTVYVARGGTWDEIGTITGYRFANSQGLLSFGKNLWLESELSGEAQEGAFSEDGYGQVIGNAVEQSNVDMVAEMSRMITLQRAFDMAIHSYEMTDTMISQAIQMRRG